MRKLYLIRHGKTRANEAHRYCGSTDLPLSEAGIRELREKRYRIPNAKFLTSGMARTEQTLRILFGDVAHETDPRFREVDFGAFELGSYEELKDDPAYIQWISGDNERNVPPHGESGAEMTRRVLGAFRELREREGTWVLITHGGVIAAILAEIYPEEGKNRYEWQPKPGEGYVLSDAGYRPITGLEETIPNP